MHTIIKMKFGSHLYGTNTPQSDTDYKGVYIPNAQDILLGRVPKTSITESTGQGMTKNTAEDVDTEMFTLQGFLRMVAEGQMVALDMLFTPRTMWMRSDNTTGVLWKNWGDVTNFAKKNLLNRRVEAFVGYCRKQAGKYGIKGSRVGEVRALLDFLKSLDNKSSKLWEYYNLLETHIEGKQFTSIIESEENRNIGGGGVKHHFANKMIECCNRKCTLTSSVKTAIEMYQQLFDAYGARAIAAETSQGVDWKAMSHAVRACYEAIELLDTGNIVFPLKHAEFLKNIKQGEYEYSFVAEHLEEAMVSVEKAAKRSKLPEEPNLKALDDFVYKVYAEVVRKDNRSVTRGGGV